MTGSFGGVVIAEGVNDLGGPHVDPLYVKGAVPAPSRVPLAGPRAREGLDFVRQGRFIASQKKSFEEDFSFATDAYLEDVRELCKQKLREIVTQNVITFKETFPNTIYKENLENIALFVVK
jgi:hypothetical protein